MKTYVLCRALEKKPKIPIKNGQRDDRGLLDMREFFVGPGKMVTSSGSCYISIGTTRVTCSVRLGSGKSSKPLLHDRATLGVDVGVAAFGKITNQPPEYYKNVSYMIEETLQAVTILTEYPKSHIEVDIFFIEDNGGCFTAALNAAAIALVDAGIKTWDTIAAVSAYCIPETVDDKTDILTVPTVIALDLSAQEIAAYENLGFLTEFHIGMLTHRSSYCCFYAKGPRVGDCLETAVEICESACESIGNEINQCLIDRAKSQQKKRRKNEEKLNT
eukprot:GHVL01003522.1.p1 GENE.GHVL01003522.1~~GHVL01003522.1.p1  ORF type:complete len:287 (+),score=46.43 GHVL01003522.1:40-861(+)